MKKKIILLPITIIIIVFSFLPMYMKYVIGIAGNEYGDFVVGLSLSNSENRHDLLFYNNDCQLINKVVLYQRGSITIGNYNGCVMIRDGVGNSELYDYSGNKLLSIDNAELLFPKFSYTHDNITIKYKQDIFGVEHIFYAKDNKLVDVDIDYDFYRTVKIKQAVLQLFLFVFLGCVFFYIIKVKT